MRFATEPNIIGNLFNEELSGLSFVERMMYFDAVFICQRIFLSKLIDQLCLFRWRPVYRF